MLEVIYTGLPFLAWGGQVKVDGSSLDFLCWFSPLELDFPSLHCTVPGCRKSGTKHRKLYATITYGHCWNTSLVKMTSDDMCATMSYAMWWEESFGMLVHSREYAFPIFHLTMYCYKIFKSSDAKWADTVTLKVEEDTRNSRAPGTITTAHTRLTQRHTFSFEIRLSFHSTIIKFS